MIKLIISVIFYPIFIYMGFKESFFCGLGWLGVSGWTAIYLYELWIKYKFDLIK